MNRKYTKEILQPLVETSKSFAEVTRKVGLKENTGSQRNLIKRIREFGIDTSHFTGKLWSKGKTLGYKRPIEDYFNGLVKITSWKLKNRLIEEGYFDRQCSSCRLDKWLDGDIPLELDHINGNKLDNSLENLRLLCPNCHTLTETYKTKNWKSRKVSGAWGNGRPA